MNLINEDDKLTLCAAVAAKDFFFNASTNLLLISDSSNANCCSLDFCTCKTLFLVPSLTPTKNKMETEDWITKYCDYSFFQTFRVTKRTFSYLMDLVGNQEVAVHSSNNQIHGRPPPVSLQTSLLILLWYLGKGETYHSMAGRFKLSTSTVHDIVSQFLPIIVELRRKFIRWPNQREAADICREFLNISGGYPGIIGAIDGTHFACVVPKDQQDSYLNRKRHHSIIMQGITDCNRVLIDIFVGYPGSCGDSRVLHESSIVLKILQEGQGSLFYNNYHLIGDKAYTVYEWLMTPYKDTGRLTQRQKRHNYMLSKARVLIENVFGLLKGRWRILKFVNVYSIEKVVDIAVACCVLHNICFLNEDYFDEMDEEDSDEEDEPNDAIEALATSHRNGIRKREHITQNL